MGMLDDRVAIISGSARGIGRATAELLSREGAKVVINHLTRDGAADELVQAAIDSWGRLDIA